MTSPTTRQLDVLRLLGGGKTLHEILRAFELSSINGVVDHVRALIRKGLVGESKAKHRAGRYTLTDLGWAALGRRRCSACHGDGTVLA